MSGSLRFCFDYSIYQILLDTISAWHLQNAARKIMGRGLPVPLVQPTFVPLEADPRPHPAAAATPGYAPFCHRERAGPQDHFVKGGASVIMQRTSTSRSSRCMYDDYMYDLDDLIVPGNPCPAFFRITLRTTSKFAELAHYVWGFKRLAILTTRISLHARWVAVALARAVRRVFSPELFRNLETAQNLLSVRINHSPQLWRRTI